MANTTMSAAPTFGGKHNAEDIPTLKALNDAEIKTLTPTIVFLLVICVVGTLGNSLVVHMYRTQMKMSNSKKCFILFLSVVDLSTCCIAIPLEVSTILEQYRFEHLWLCKISRVSNSVGTMSSWFILLIIAIDRFRKVCKPFGWQIQTRVAKLLCGLALFLGVMLSWPAVFIYGKHTFDIPEHNMTGTECSISDEVIYTRFPFIYAFALGFVVISGTVAIATLYCLIGHKIRKHTRKMNEVFGRNMSIPSTSPVLKEHDSKVLGKVDSNAMTKHEIAYNRNKNILEKKRTKKTNESDDSWAVKRDYEPSFTFSPDIRKKDKSQMSHSNIDSIEKDFPGNQNDHNSTLENNEIKNEAGADEKKQKKSLNNSAPERDRIKKSEALFQKANTSDIKTEVSPISSEEIIPKQKSIIRRMASLCSQMFNLVMQLTFIKRVQGNSDPRTLQKKQFLAEARARKTTFVMFIVTLGFIFSSLPHLLLSLIRQVKGDFVEELSDTSKALYKFFLRSYFLNNAINPVIYSICDSQFKSACKNSFGRCFRKADHVT